MKRTQNNEPERINDENLNYSKNDSGVLLSKQISNVNLYSGKNWESLISKHTARYDIWMFLNLYQELNVSQISNYLKQSKSTVSRILRAMESDGLLISKRGKKKVGERERIPPKYYRISDKYQKEEEVQKEFLKIPSDPQELHDFLLSEIQTYKSAIYNVVRLVNYLGALLNNIDSQLENIENAKKIYEEFLSGINEPEFNFIFLDKKQFKQFYDLRLEYTLKLKKLIMEHEIDPESAFVYFDSFLPLMRLLKSHKKEI